MSVWIYGLIVLYISANVVWAAIVYSDIEEWDQYLKDAKMAFQKPHPLLFFAIHTRNQRSNRFYALSTLLSFLFMIPTYYIVNKVEERRNRIVIKH